MAVGRSSVEHRRAGDAVELVVVDQAGRHPAHQAHGILKAEANHIPKRCVKPQEVGEHVVPSRAPA
jgi:hypothetical protein